MLQILDKHYGAVMMCNAHAKELYSLKERLGENVAEYRVHLLQQVQILQLEYPGRIWPKHMEEMKHDHFCEGLNPEYWQMLAYKVYGKNAAGYSGLLLAT